tara:strand:- start:736 stop:2841 length:2106 start_codon:yes stop_codon:yes gene_type:complete
MSKTLIKDEYINDYQRCFKLRKKISDTWFVTGSQNITNINSNLSPNLLLNSNVRGLFHIDNYPSISFLNKNNINLLNRFQKLEKFKTYNKIKILNKYYASSHIINFRNFLKIQKHLNLKKKILEIGAGAGILSSMIYRYSKCQVYICDIPETLILQKYYLRKNFPKAKINFIANETDNINKKSDFTLINNSLFNKVKIKMDLVINIDSFSEMDRKDVKQYIFKSNNLLKKNGMLFMSNTIGHSKNSYNLPTDYPVPKNISISNFTVGFLTSRDTFARYFDVYLKKKIKKAKKKETNLKIFKNIYKNYEFLSLNNRNKILFKKYFEKFYKNKIKFNKKAYLNDSNQSEILYTIISSIFIDFTKSDNIRLKKQLIKFITDDEILNYLRNDTTCFIKILIFLRILDQKTFLSNVNKLSNKIFEESFFKSIFLASLKIKEKKRIINFLNINSNDFFNLLKQYFVASKINNEKYKLKIIKKLFLKTQNKLFSTYFLKLLIFTGESKDFIKYFKIFDKKNLLVYKNILVELNKTCFKSKKEHKKFFKLIDKKLNLNGTTLDYLNDILLKFKVFKIKEKDFISTIRKKYWNDYYSLGYVLRCTVNILKKKNVLLLANRSLFLRKNKMNYMFLFDILLFNSIFNKIKFSYINNPYFEIKKNLFINKKNNQFIKNDLIFEDYFRILISGSTSLIPFLNTAGNHLQISTKS